MSTGIAASQLAKMSQEELFMNLGALHKEDKQRTFNILSMDEDAATTRGQDDVEAGKSFFERLNQQAHDFFCGDCGSDDNTDCLDRLKKALGISADQATIITAVSTLLVASLGWGAAIAGIVAAILVKFFLPATLENICVEWNPE